jgi:uncharacterized membrane protein
MKDIDIEKLLLIEDQQIRKLADIVKKTMDEEKLMVDNLLHAPEVPSTKGQLVSDKVAKFGGSWKFIIIFGVILVIWIVLNSVLLGKKAFDPYPFILMNLILSCIAAMQAPIIMMSQNRQEEKDRKRSENDYLINLKAELEVRGLNQKVDILLQEQINALIETQAKQLEILKAIQIKIEA